MYFFGLLFPLLIRYCSLSFPFRFRCQYRNTEEGFRSLLHLYAALTQIQPSAREWYSFNNRMYSLLHLLWIISTFIHTLHKIIPVDVIHVNYIQNKRLRKQPAVIELINKPQISHLGHWAEERKYIRQCRKQLYEWAVYTTGNIEASTFNSSPMGFIFSAGLIVSKAMKQSTGTLVPHKLMDSSLRQLFTRTRRPFSVTWRQLHKTIVWR